ncbi:hypothetical protein KR032_002485 [Drosophila birchii]|nr:hypothetical protein KR032_002485 [Drosophila birchii]
MSWFEKAKTVLIEALDIQDDDSKAAAAAAAATTDKADKGAAGASSGQLKDNDGAGLATAGTSFTSSSVPATPATGDTPTFFDNPHANEMVTIPPRASDPTNTTSASTSTPYAKRQSATSDSVDLLSSPTSPVEEVSASVSASASVSISAGNKRHSESSLELITATTASELEMEMELSPDTEPSLPDSIVIIASNDTSDNAEGDGEDDEEDEDEGTQLERHMEDHLNDSTRTMKALVFSDTQAAGNLTAGGADSDSTQSFEDIQMMQLSHKGASTAGKSHLSTGPSAKPEMMVDQSYSSTSSDIEIISNPNGDSSTNSTTTRTSPQKFKELAAAGKAAAAGSVGCSGSALKPKGHHREPSEISLLSEDSQSELDKLVHRISELNQVIEAREQRLLQSERQNAELLECNQELRARIEAAANSANSPDAADDAVQRLSALEKKFQASIRERDALRIQIKSLRDELQNKIPRDELTECNEMIAGLQSEGEKLSKEILQQSTIIKKLRAKEKTSDTLLKKNGEQISLLSSESERLKRSLAAKEEMERTQIEAVCRMTAEKRRADDDYAEGRGRIKDLQSQLAALQIKFDSLESDIQKQARLKHERMRAEHDEYVQQNSDLREKLRLAEHNLVRREQQLREENRQLVCRLEAAELRAESSTQELSATTSPLIRQIESLQRTLDQRSAGWNREEQQLLQKLDAAEVQLRSLSHLNTVQEEKYALLSTRCSQVEEKLSSALLEATTGQRALRQQEANAAGKDNDFKKQISSLEDKIQQQAKTITDLEQLCKQQQQLAKAEADNQKQLKPHSSLLTVEAVEMAGRMQQQQLNMPTKAQQAVAVRSSPPLSLVDDEEEALGHIIDWQAVRGLQEDLLYICLLFRLPQDDLDCASNSGRQPSGIIQGVHLNFLAANTTTSTLEHLQALLKQRDGELTHMQWELSRLRAERDVLDGEISNVTFELETLKEKVVEFEEMQAEFVDLQHRYDALLQMYGEKVERTDELELDLTELKAAYKLQIDELLAAPPPNLQLIPKQT